MLLSDHPCLSLTVEQLKSTSSNHYAVWVIQAPYPGGYVHHDCLWSDGLTQSWHAWQELFCLRGLPLVPRVSSASLVPAGGALLQEAAKDPAKEIDNFPNPSKAGYAGRLMQHLGILLWQWLFDGAIQNSLNQSQGIAIGQNKPLRLRLDIRDPNLVALPWEIMQAQAGKQAISLSQQILFSRTTSDVDPLPLLRVNQSLKVLLVLGQEVDSSAPGQSGSSVLKLEQEATTLANIFRSSSRISTNNSSLSVACQVDTLVQPTPAELIDSLERDEYNILFYGGHGIPAPNGGLLKLRPGITMNGTELAQVLTRRQVTLAVFNACWSAQPDQDPELQRAIPRSSLAEVLIHHGVPAVLGMRDSIADQEALSFIHAFAQALAERLPIDQAVAVARQHLLTLYKFNQPAWTLPVLYMHPEFDGELLKPFQEGTTELPRNSPTLVRHSGPVASLRLLEMPHRVWPVQGGLMRVGRLAENDLVIQEQWVSQKHAEIFCRDTIAGENAEPTYYLRDFSRYGTLISSISGWQKVHRQEVPLFSGVRLKFGSSQGQTLEFLLADPE